jgi:hypothetical protein
MTPTTERAGTGDGASPGPPGLSSGGIFAASSLVALASGIARSAGVLAAVLSGAGIITVCLAWDTWRIRRAGFTLAQAWPARRAGRRQAVADRAARLAARQLASQSSGLLPWLADKSAQPGDQPGVLITPPPDAPYPAAGGGYDVVLVDGGLTKIQLIKQVRTLTRLSLKDAKDLVDAAPAAILRVPDEGMGRAARAMLEGAGGTVSIRPAGQSELTDGLS